jgi:cytochrome c-type biogenesis protein CcmH
LQNAINETDETKSGADFYQVIVTGAAAAVWAYQRHRQKTNVHIMALNLVRGVPLTSMEKETMLNVLTPSPPPRRWLWFRR